MKPDKHAVDSSSFWHEIEEVINGGTLLDVCIVEGVLCDSYAIEGTDEPILEGYRYLIAQAECISDWSAQYNITFTDDRKKFIDFCASKEV